MIDVATGWESRGKPAALFRRFEFDRYGQTRDFLDALAALSESSGVHPQNINFGSKYVNITLDAQEPSLTGAANPVLAEQINALYASTAK